MQQFKFSEEGFKKIRKKWLTIMIPLVTIIVVTVILVNLYTGRNGETSPLPFVVPFLAVLFGFSIYRSLQKQKKFLLHYSVTISDEGITRDQLNTAPLSINFMEIKEIIKTEKGGFMIKGVNRGDVIHIPYLIDSPEAVEACLQKLAPITFRTRDPFYMKYRMYLFFLAVGMMICVYTLTNKILVGVCGTLLTGLFAWAFYEVQVSKNATAGAKRSSWYFLIVIIAIIYIMYAKLTGIWELH